MDGTAPVGPTNVVGLSDSLYAYDSFSRLTSVVDTTGTHSYSYDDLDATTAITTSYAGLASTPSANVPLSFAFNPDGSRASLSTPAGAFQYYYDGIGRLTQLTNPSSESSSWGYLNNNWLSTTTLRHLVAAIYWDSKLSRQ